MSDNLYSPPSAEVRDISEGSERDVEIRNAHLSHEASLRAFGMLFYIGSVLMIFGAIGLLLGAMGRPDLLEDGILFGMLALYLVFGVAAFFAGRGLRALSPRIKILVTLMAIPGLIGFPVGTLINAYLLYLVWSAKGRMVLSEEYQGIRERTPEIKYRTSILVWILIGILVLGIGAAIVLPMFSG